MNTARQMQAAINVKTGAPIILVTGATGFLGKHLVRTLLAEGSAVRALGRNLKIGLELSDMGADFRPVDLRDEDAVVACCEGVNAVVHAGAMSTAWGKRQDFHDINVGGTENIIKGCRAHGVTRLVYISSPSVMSRFEDQVGLTESLPMPTTFVSVYSETKALAEKRVRHAASEGMATVILRPKAIYGPGDQALFPRLREAISKGRLPILGDGKTVTNITHVRDVVQAVLLALKSEKALGNTYVISGDEEVNLLEIANIIAERMGYPAPSRKIPMDRALIIGRALEGIWDSLHLKGEPPLTRYKASVLGHSQTYDITAARRDLGYEPKVAWQDGVEEFLKDLESSGETVSSESHAPGEPEPSGDPANVEVTVLSAGSTEAREIVFGSGTGLKTVEIPALFAVIRHPVFGSGLFDTGYSTHFFEATEKFPASLYARATPVKITEEENAARQLDSRGIDPADVRWIIVSHFDPDHIGGLRDFPRARIICHWQAWDAVQGKTGFKALAARFLPGLAPSDLTARLLVLPDPTGPAIGPFETSMDLFGDASVRLVLLSGHASGMIGAFVNTAGAPPLFLCADACWSTDGLESGRAGGGAHRLIAEDRAKQNEIYRKLEQLHRDFPEMTIVPSHCPRVAERYVGKTLTGGA